MKLGRGELPPRFRGVAQGGMGSAWVPSGGRPLAESWFVSRILAAPPKAARTPLPHSRHADCSHISDCASRGVLWAPPSSEALHSTRVTSGLCPAFHPPTPRAPRKRRPQLGVTLQGEGCISPSGVFLHTRPCALGGGDAPEPLACLT